MKNYKITAILFLLCIMVSCDKKDLERTNSHDPKSKNYRPSTPTLTTANATAIGINSATSGGNVTFDGGAAINVRGVCWNTATNPTINLNKTTNGAGIGSYTSDLTGLTASTKYYVRAYATNSSGTAYGNEITFTTNAPLPGMPTLTTNSITLITSTTATSGGNITNSGGTAVTVRGVCWSTTVNPTVALTTKTSDGSNTGAFTSNLTGLAPSTLYYVRAYATNSTGTAYGNEVSFTTGVGVPGVPALTTTAITLIGSTTATSGGNITSDGGASVTARGVCWSTTTGPTTALATKTANGTGIGTFVSNITGLTESTLYYVRAYATNSLGTAYGTEISFTTSTPAVIPTITTSSITNNLGISATTGGNISANGGAPVTARGVCWGPNLNPTISDSKTSDATGSGTFTSNLTGLTLGTSYHVRAYAINSAGTAYGQDVAFTTPTLPTITTTAITSIEQTTASGGGDVTLDGGANVTVRGICWSISPNPTIDLNTKTTDGSGTGGFTSSMTGLSPVITYHVRAYATNSAGTAYGADVTFVTSAPVVPTLTTSVVSSVTLSAAAAGGNITSDGFATVTSRGVCWSTSVNPTVALTTKTADGTGSGAFTSSIASLTSNTTYYLRAYATNSAGTGYGNEVIFKTSHSTLTDVDGNTYNAIQIGTQIWMRENLKTTKYRDGNFIANITDNTAWSQLTTGAYCWYNNDAATNKNTYGAMYNWYTITDSRILCPTGWHIPTDVEWTALVTTLGGNSAAGGKLKETGIIPWLSPNTGATNESGFTALPGGYRNNSGLFNSISAASYIWSATEYDATNAWYHSLTYSNTYVNRSTLSKVSGLSVRCIKD